MHKVMYKNTSIKFRNITVLNLNIVNYQLKSHQLSSSLVSYVQHQYQTVLLQRRDMALNPKLALHSAQKQHNMTDHVIIFK